MRRLFKRLGAAVAVLAAVAAIFLYFNPPPISSFHVLLNSIMGSSVAAPGPAALDRLRLPPGFSVDLYAKDLANPRMLRFTAGGDLLVSTPRAGKVILLERDRNGDGRADGRRVLLKGLNRPHGLALDQGWLYVGENTAIGRVRLDEQSGRLTGDYQQIVTGLTGKGNHWSKTVGIGPDGYLYVAQGSTCNVCEEEDKRRATIMRFKADGSDGVIYATGLRNSVGFDWAPWDNGLYATDNGRDMLGDDFPPCELNLIREHGFYGWPYINGNNVLDPDLGKGHEDLLKTAIPPAFNFRAHNAPLGIHFLRQANLRQANLRQGKMPAGYERAALVALHGSWNRSKPDGYKVVSLHWRDDGSIEQRDFLSGFVHGDDVIGRPVDIAEGPDGAIYISDDYAGVIYRVSYGVSAPAAAAAPAEQPALREDAQLQALSASERQQLQQQGAQLFRRYPCGNCHEQGGGFRTVKPLRNLSARYTVAELDAFFVTPTPPMPVFPLKPEERRALAVYLLTR